MGNQICCEEQYIKAESKSIDQLSLFVNHQQINKQKQVKIIIPELSQQILNYINSQSQLQTKMEGYLSPNSHEVFKISDQVIYVGPVDELKKPNGEGKLFMKNGDFYLGELKEGKAEGFGYFIKKDGTWYRGYLKDNKANDQKGQFCSKQFYYRGGFKNNLFNGQGFEKTQNYQFDGLYKDSRKVTGTLKWRQNGEQNVYEGKFNDKNELHGEGVLKSSKGVYNGFFKKGQKCGSGTFTYVSGLVFNGYYKNNLREYGQILDAEGMLIYQGEFKDGFPHGQGYTMNNGLKVECKWEFGIQETLL